MSAVGIVGAIGVGIAFGYVSHRGAFCLNSGFRNVVVSKDATKLKALGLAVALQLVFVPAVFALDAANSNLPMFAPLAQVIGGVVFGASMRWATGCAAGVIYKSGGGSRRGLIAFVGLALGAAAFEVGPFQGARVSLQSIGATTNTDIVTALGGSFRIVAPLVGLVLAGVLLFTKDSKAGAWSWRRTGVLLGVIGVACWPLSSLGGRDFGLSVVPGAVGAVAAPLQLAFSPWDLVLVVGVFVGGWVAARRSESSPTPQSFSTRTAATTFAGGVGLGVGGSLAGGCTVGHGLTGLALFAPGSYVGFAAIAVGAILTAIPQRRAALAGPKR